MATTDSFADLKARLGAGDQTAPAEIVRRYSEQLIRLAAPRVAGSLRRKVGPDDLVQSALKSFFRADPVRAFALNDWENLWSILATLTLRKSRAAVRHFLAAKRNINREQFAAPDASSSAQWEFAASEPTPAESATLNDLVQRLLNGLDDKTRQIAELALLGHTREEIAPLVGLSERSVYRKLESVRDLLLKLDPDPDDD